MSKKEVFMAKPESFDILTKPNIKILVKQVVDENTRASLSKLRSILSAEELPRGLTTAIFSVFIEMINNVRMHSARRKVKSDAPLGVLLLGSDSNAIYVQSVNVVANGKVSDIDTKLGRMNSHIKKELRKYYKHRRKFENPNRESEGAGLGLIEIAKRSKTSVDYDFKPSIEGYSLFTMCVVFNKGGNK